MISICFHFMRPRCGVAVLMGVFAISQMFFMGSVRAQTLKEAEIKDMFTGNTIAGVYVGGGPFSEYHAPDGRALGDNGLQINIDACWNVDQDRVCYHYGPYKDRRTYCFSVEKTGDKISLRVSDTGKLNALANIEPGNPKGHGDGGRRWSCDDLLSGSVRNSVAARPE